MQQLPYLTSCDLNHLEIMPATYQGLDLECVYPDNWAFSEDLDSEEGQTQGFTLESPDAAFFSLTRYPWNCAPSKVIEMTQQTLESEYEQAEAYTVEPGLGIDDSRAAEINFYCLDFLVTSRIIAFTIRPYTYLVQIQAEDRTFDELTPVFEAILYSILRSLGKDQKPSLV